MSGTTFTWTGAGDTTWTDPTNWQVGGAPTAIAPNDPTAIAIATGNGPDGFEFPIISGGAAIQLASLSSTDQAHVIVGGGPLGGAGSATLTAGSISVTSTNIGGGLVGGLGSTITTSSLTVGAGALVGGGGTYIVTSLLNSGIIQADGGDFGLGPLTVKGGTITGTGTIEVDGNSTFELGSATAETITVVVAPTETATVIFDNPGSFTGSLNLFNADTHLNLFFQGQTPTGATFDGKSLIVTGAAGTIDVIPMTAIGPVVLGTSASGEVSISSLQLPAPILAPASDSGIKGDNITNVGLPTITGNGVSGATVTLLDGAAAIGTGTVAADGTWSVTATTALAEGLNAITATQTDTAGNTSAPSAALNVTLDTTVLPPTALILAAASDSGTKGDNTTNVGLPTIAGNGESGATVTLLDGAATIGTGTVAADGTWSIAATTALAEGLNAITATQTDVAGNASAPSTALNVTLDTTVLPPAALALTPASDSGITGDNITNVSTPTITGTGEDGGTVTLLDGTTTVGTATVAGGTWTITAAAALADGPHSLIANQLDVAGNSSLASSALNFIVDTVAPLAPAALVLTAASDSGIKGDNVTNVSNPTISGTGEDGDTVTLVDGTVTIGTATVAGGTWTIIAAAALADGPHSLIANQRDVAGNASLASAALDFIVDTVAPVAPAALALTAASDSGIKGDNITNVSNPTISGTGEDGDTVTLLDGTTTIGTGTVVGGVWSITAASALAPGSNPITATQIDLAGNISVASAVPNVTLDTTPVQNDITPVQPTVSGDGRTDILWQNDNGSVAIWLMDAAGTTPIAAPLIGTNPGPAWRVKGTGDFNGDGHADVLWQNDNGSVAIWLMDAAGTTPIAAPLIGTNPGPAWHVKGTGDFNGDGHADILWQNDNGSVATWLMDAAGTTPIAAPLIGTNPGPAWHVKGTGDFNGDGHADILWQNDNGSVAIWLMNAAGTTPIAEPLIGTNPGPAWHVKGTGDFNGDGHADVLWQNDNGSVATWLMDAPAPPRSPHALIGTNPGPAWHVKGTGDFNGDGHADILWQNDNGSVATWLMDAAGTTPIAAPLIGTNPGPAWHTIGSDDMHFINGTSTTGTLAATSQADEFVLTSHVIGLETISGFDAESGHRRIEQGALHQLCRRAGPQCGIAGRRSDRAGQLQFIAVVRRHTGTASRHQFRVCLTPDPTVHSGCAAGVDGLPHKDRGAHYAKCLRNTVARCRLGLPDIIKLSH